jgi:hypothetical protein
MNLYEPTKKFLALSILVAVFSLAGISLITWVLFAKILMINKEVLRTNEMNISVEQAYKLKAQLNEVEDDLKTLDSFFVAPNSEIKFIEKIEAIASSTKVELDIQSISVDSKNAAKNTNFKNDILFNLEAKGEKEALITFLQSLESMPKAIFIDRADLASSEDHWTLHLNAYAYQLR